MPWDCRGMFAILILFYLIVYTHHIQHQHQRPNRIHIGHIEIFSLFSFLFLFLPKTF